MIEIPESRTLARQLNESFKGKRIVAVEIEHTSHGFAWYSGTQKEYEEIMTGQVIGQAEGLGSFVDIVIGKYRFTINDGINLRCYSNNEKLPGRYQMSISLEDGTTLICTVQMYGGMMLFDPDTYDNPYYLKAKEKPMPGTDDFDWPWFKSLRAEAAGNLSAKAFLATEQRIPGLGNGILQDILLESGIHPKRKLGTMREADLKRMYQAIISVTRQMTEAGGRDTEKDLWGEAGGYRTKLSKKTNGAPCPYCGTEIQKATYLGGTIYFCPRCQSLN